jgi:hypothetical protein
MTSLVRPLLDPEDEHVTVVQNAGRYRSMTKCHIPVDLKGRSYCRFLRPVTSSTNLKYTSTVWPVPPLPQRTPLLNSLRGAKYPEVGSRLFSAHSTTHSPVLS